MSTLNNKTKNFIKEVYERKEIVKNPSCYIYDLSKIKENIEALEMYAPPQISLYYAMKANPHKRVMSYVRGFDFVKGIEIASIGELKKALKCYKADEIIFTGPGKSEEELKASLKKGIRLINIESVVEAIRINNLAKKLRIKKVDILIRINTNYSMSGAREYMAGISTKMGIDEDKFIEALEVIKTLDRIHIKGIHVFAASGILNYKNLIKYAKYIFSFVAKVEKINGQIDIIDFGGGIGIDYTHKNEIFDLKSFFTELKGLIEHYKFSEKEIILELGTYIVGNCGYFTSKILDIKQIKDLKHIILAGGINHMGLPLETGKKHPVHVIPMKEKKIYKDQEYVLNEVVNINGPLCMDTDKLSWNDKIEKAEIGDIVLFRQAGAYCYSLSMLEFLSHPYPKEIFMELD